MNPEKLAAFIDYVCRPMIEDIRKILDRVESLKLPINRQMLESVATRLILIHLLSTLIQAISYVIITGIVCRAATLVLTHS